MSYFFIILNYNNHLIVNEIMISPDAGQGQYGCVLKIKEEFPESAGIITEIINKTRALVSLNGLIVNVVKNLVPHETYFIDIDGHIFNGNTTLDFGEIAQTTRKASSRCVDDMNNDPTIRPFLITGNQDNIASIVYNSMLCNIK